MGFVVFIALVGGYLFATFGLSVSLARLARRSSKAFMAVVAGGLLALIAAVLLGRMEWETLRLTGIGIGLGLANGFALEYAMRQRLKYPYLLAAIAGAVVCSYLVTKNMYPEPTLFLLAILFYGIPGGSAAGMGLTALLIKLFHME